MSSPDPMSVRLQDLNRTTLGAVLNLYEKPFNNLRIYLEAVRSNVEHGHGDHLPGGPADAVAVECLRVLVNELMPTLRNTAAHNRLKVLAESLTPPAKV